MKRFILKCCTAERYTNSVILNALIAMTSAWRVPFLGISKNILLHWWKWELTAESLVRHADFADVNSCTSYTQKSVSAVCRQKLEFVDRRVAFLCKQLNADLWKSSSRGVRTASCLKGSDSGRKGRKPCYFVNCQDFLCTRSLGVLLPLCAIKEANHHLAKSISKVHHCNKCHSTGI